MHASPFLPRVAAAALSLVVPLTLASCGSSAGSSPNDAGETPAVVESSASEAPEPSAESGAADATPGTTLTACELVAPGDIETALGLEPGSVMEGTVKPAPTTLDPAANECRYDGQDWGGLVVLATPTNGVNTFNALAKVYGEDGEAVEVGDGAYWFENNDRGYFLKGPVMVIVQFTFIADGTKFRDPSIELGKALVAKV